MVGLSPAHDRSRTIEHYWVVNTLGRVSISACLALGLGCTSRVDVPQDSGGTTEGDGEADEGSTTNADGGGSPPGGGEEGPGTSSGDSGPLDESGSTSGAPPQCDDPGGPIWRGEPAIPADCEDELDRCRLDSEFDGVVFTCDNAPEVHNPDQADADSDGFGDVIDLCPVIPGEFDDTSDSDRDGVGNGCDNCRSRASVYNEVLEAAGVPATMRVRNFPDQLDTDMDGIGDACDNCPTVPNCGDFGPDNPARVDSPVPWDDPVVCQADANANGIGDACEALPGVGFDEMEDFDQDGIPNGEDLCPRYAAETADDDQDGIGNACDTCRFTPNIQQLTAPEEDDQDGDFVGAACEPGVDCSDRASPLNMGFFDVAVDGFCCVTMYPGDNEWVDPDTRPVSSTCSPGDEEGGMCRTLPAAVANAPGMGVMPPGCEQLLADGCQAHPVTLDDVGGDPIALWDFACFLPPRDQDFDGLGDECDLCRFAFDPTNTPYTDEQGRLWPNDGQFCNGEYNEVEFDPADGCFPG